MDPRRAPIYATLDALDEEAFSGAVASLQAMARERGGYKDQDGLANLQLACRGYDATRTEPA